MGQGIDAAESPIFGDFIIQHRIVYLFSGDMAHEAGFVDPWVQSNDFGDRLIDWLCYATVNDIIPLVDPDGENDDTNWLFDMYLPTWRLRIDNEYQSALAAVRQEENLFAPYVEFGTKKRQYLGVE
jgi:hypothetical protein